LKKDIAPFYLFPYKKDNQNKQYQKQKMGNKHIAFNLFLQGFRQNKQRNKQKPSRKRNDERLFVIYKVNYFQKTFIGKNKNSPQDKHNG
jgi:hypothetical protein